VVRRAALGGGTLNPFSGGGTDFGAFNILNAGNEAYLIFVKVETAWNAGKATNDEYLAALGVYANAQDAGSSDWVSAQARLENAKYTVGRNVLSAGVDARTVPVSDLVAYDKQSLAGLLPDSGEYQQRLGAYRSSQSQLISDEEKKKVDLYQAGKLTTTALRAWYQGVLDGPTIDQNPDLVESIKGRVDELTSRAQDEKDSKMLSDFNDGKVTTHDFLAYATAAKGRYAAGTSQALEWDGRIKDAATNASETALLYRYNLSQQYAQLAEFVKGNAAGGGGTSTSHSTRVILGADGKWKTVNTTTTKATKPSASEVAAHAKLQIEIADAKKQMAQIAAKVGSVGGFVQSSSILKFYSTKLGKVVKGSAEWYAIQGKIDNVNDRIHHEQVTAKEGIRVTYPGGGGGSAGGSVSTASGGGGGGGTASSSSSRTAAGAGGGGYSIGAFMRAIATQESGGRYDARNASTGAYGKYQILPSNWSSWAQKAGLPANAPQTPENQEKVATAAFGRLAKSYNNDWSRVAAAWFGGVAGELNRGPRTQRYVDAIMSHMGTTRAAVSAGAGGGTSPGAASHPAAAGGHGAASSAAANTHPVTTGSGPLGVITSVSVAGRKGATEVVTTHNTGFPTNLDGRAFEKFYANYENAFESGAESFVDTSSGKAVSYFIGGDPAERIDRMRHLDDLRVSLFDTRAVAYQGTASELTAINARNNAYKDVARHEYLIVDTATNMVKDPKTGKLVPGSDRSNSGSAVLNAKTNPIGAGIRLLDKTKIAIASNLAMAEAAYKRGDLTGAIALYEEANELKKANGATMQLLAGYADAADARIAAITRASGGITPEAAGAGEGFTTDLDRLHGFDVEITDLFQGKPDEVQTELNSHIQFESDGSVKYDDPGSPLKKVVLTPDTYFLLKPNGDVSVESRPPVYDGNKGKMGFSDDKTIEVKVKVGNDVIEAQTAFTVGQVGSFVSASGQLFPIMGKFVQVKNAATGKWESFYENPMAPGNKNGDAWSATPFVFAAPTGFKSTVDAKGGASYSWSSSQGNTYAFVFDPKTGTYGISRSNPGGLFNSAVVDEPVGFAGSAEFDAILTGSGVVRQGGGSGFDSSDQPVFGFGSADEYSKWKHDAFQAPALAELGKVSPSRQTGLGQEGPNIKRLAVDNVAAAPATRRTGLGQEGPNAGGLPAMTGLELHPGKAADDRADLPALPVPPTTGKWADDTSLSSKKILGPPAPALNSKKTGLGQETGPVVTKPKPKPKPAPLPPPVSTSTRQRATL
jgi:Transglycosylase SLT domain